MKVLDYTSTGCDCAISVPNHSERLPVDTQSVMFENLKPPRMETITTTAKILHVPVHFVRAKVKNGEVVAVRAGRRFLVNVDKFAEYLNTSTVHPESGTEPHSAARVSPIGK